ncbi:MAG: protein-tyrosine phosphatase [Paracoccaceae bacterium]|jgi:protein-tyrosine phosphatase
MPLKILFVCLGNICRSAAAEGVFRALAPEMQTDSAGTSNWHVGEPPYGAMQQAARARGVDISGLRARQFEPVDFTSFDLILAMDAQNLQDIEALRPPNCPTPVQLFTNYAAKTGANHVPDPYYTRDFDGVLDLIETAALGLHQALTA